MPTYTIFEACRTWISLTLSKLQVFFERLAYKSEYIHQPGCDLSYLSALFATEDRKETYQREDRNPVIPPEIYYRYQAANE